jgi:hypothetical protein
MTWINGMTQFHPTVGAHETAVDCTEACYHVKLSSRCLAAVSLLSAARSSDLFKLTRTVVPMTPFVEARVTATLHHMNYGASCGQVKSRSARRGDCLNAFLTPLLDTLAMLMEQFPNVKALRDARITSSLCTSLSQWFRWGPSLHWGYK